jgi:hypothetical protein
LWWIVLLAGGVATCLLAMLVARRLAPSDGWFWSREIVPTLYAASVSPFAILLAFVVLLSFNGYVRARDGASSEAVAVSQLYRLTSLMPGTEAPALREGLICYARAVISDEWPAMANGRPSLAVEAALGHLEDLVDRLPLATSRTEIALADWLAVMTTRREGRRARLVEATEPIPPVILVGLLLGAGALLASLLMFANRKERLGVQMLLTATTMGLAITAILMVVALDQPFDADRPLIAPHSMQQTLAAIQADLSPAPPPISGCDERGLPT